MTIDLRIDGSPYFKNSFGMSSILHNLPFFSFSSDCSAIVAFIEVVTVTLTVSRLVQAIVKVAVIVAVCQWSSYSYGPDVIYWETIRTPLYSTGLIDVLRQNVDENKL